MLFAIHIGWQEIAVIPVAVGGFIGFVELFSYLNTPKSRRRAIKAGPGPSVVPRSS